MVLGDIGKAAGDQFFDDRAHLRDVLGGARLHRRRQAAERGDVVLVLLIGFFGDLADRLVQRQAGEIACGAVVDLVVDVGDVADIFDMRLAIEVAQQLCASSFS